MNKIINGITNEEEYQFEELSLTAQEKALQVTCELYSEYHIKDLDFLYGEEIKNMFPNSNLKHKYAFSFKNNEFFGIYGEISLETTLKITGISFNEDEKEIFNNIMPNIIINPEHEAYFERNMINVYIDKNTLNNYNIDNIKFSEKTKKMENKLRDYVESFYENMRTFGYNFIYPTNETILIDFIHNNQLKFKENGYIKYNFYKYLL